MSSAQPTGSTTFKAAISSGILVLANYYKERRFDKTQSLKKAGYQLVSSLVSQNLENIIRGFLPQGSQIRSMYLNPVLVGGSYTLLAYIIDGDKNYVANFLISAGSEVATKYVEGPITAALSTQSKSVGF